MRGPVQYVALVNAVGGDRLKLPSGLQQIAAQTFVENWRQPDHSSVPLYQVENVTYTSYFVNHDGSNPI